MARIWEVSGASGQTLTIETDPCFVCKEKSLIAGVDPVAYRSWRLGTLIQNAFPEWGLEQRELLKTGIHAACWEKLEIGGE